MSSTQDQDDSIFSMAQRIDRTPGLPESRVVTFISARSGEGTSSVARDYARVLAGLGDCKILLIDAGKLDVDFFTSANADSTVTIADTVADGGDVEDALFSVGRNVQAARWAGEGRSRAAANKLLGDDKFWKALRKAYDTVVIDAPSLQESADGIALAARADAVVVVVEAEATRQPVVEHLRDSLTAAGAKIIGIVMNKRRFYIPESVYRNL